MNPLDSIWCDEVPADVLRLVEQFERSTGAAREAVNRQAAEIRRQAEAEIDAAFHQADAAVRTQAEALAREVRPLLEAHLKAGRLGEALAVRERLRGLRTCLLDLLPDPGMVCVTPDQYGQTILYEVTGAGGVAAGPYGQHHHGAVWGTDVYCGDSSLALACVHAGVLKPGETGAVKVTVLDKNHPGFQGSNRNGVTSFAWQFPYPAFRVSRA